TTSNLIGHTLKENHIEIIHNNEGANMAAGITSAFILQIKKETKIDVIEIDEGSIPRVLNEVTPTMMVVTNFFRDAPDRLIAGVEVGGIHASEDNGQTWTERRNGLQDDIHHVLMLGAEEYIASTGGGLYRTRNAGRSWSRMDEQLDRSYFRESFKSNGRLYTSAALK